MAITISSAAITEPIEVVSAALDGPLRITITAAFDEPVDAVYSWLEVAEAITVTADILEPVDTLVSALSIPVTITAEFVEPVDTLAAIFNVPICLSGTLTEPKEAVSATLTFKIQLSAAFSEPVDVVSAVLSVISATLPVADHKKVIVLNVANNGLSEYEDYPFDKIFELNGNIYGVIPDDGIYLLEGTTDAGAAIDTAMQTGLSDFGTSRKKGVANIYAGAELYGAAVVQAVTDGNVKRFARTVTGASSEPENYRVRLPYSHLSRYWGVEVKNVAGAASSIDSIEIEPGTIQGY